MYYQPLLQLFIIHFPKQTCTKGKTKGNLYDHTYCFLSSLYIMSMNVHTTVGGVNVSITDSLFIPADKICDQVSDAVLDAHLKIDPDAKVSGDNHIFMYLFICMIDVIREVGGSEWV